MQANLIEAKDKNTQDGPWKGRYCLLVYVAFIQCPMKI